MSLVMSSKSTISELEVGIRFESILKPSPFLVVDYGLTVVSKSTKVTLHHGGISSRNEITIFTDLSTECKMSVDFSLTIS